MKSSFAIAFIAAITPFAAVVAVAGGCEAGLCENPKPPVQPPTVYPPTVLPPSVAPPPGSQSQASLNASFSPVVNPTATISPVQSATGAANNTQRNDSASYSYGSPMNNYQINNAYGQPSANVIGAQQVTCQGPNFQMGVGILPNSFYDGWGNYGATYQPSANLNFTIPLGGAIAQCRTQATLINQRTAFAFAADQLKQCIDLRKEGIDLDLLDPKLFGNLATICKSVSLGQKPEVYVPPARIQPQPQPKPEPVRGLW